nr:hypothetical protein [Microbacterium bovistercoris]
MTPDTALSVQLDAICGRNQYTQHPGPVIDELRAAAGDRPDVLLEAVGTWAGYFDTPETHVLSAAIIEAFPACEPWVQVGRRRHGTRHSTTRVLSPSWPTVRVGSAVTPQAG